VKRSLGVFSACTDMDSTRGFSNCYRRYSLSQLHRVFTTDVDGYSLQTFFRRCQFAAPTMLVLETTQGEVFGAYLCVAVSTTKEPTWF
jgi:hypothetical protein